MHVVLQVKDSSDSSQQPVIVCTNQVLSDKEAAVMRANSWLYQFYSLHSKMHFGLAYEAHTPVARPITIPAAYYPSGAGIGMGKPESGAPAEAMSPHAAAYPTSTLVAVARHESAAQAAASLASSVPVPVLDRHSYAHHHPYAHHVHHHHSYHPYAHHMHHPAIPAFF